MESIILPVMLTKPVMRNQVTPFTNMNAILRVNITKQ